MTVPPRLSRAAGRGPRRRGFSLLEIMIAIGILGVGLVMISAIFPVALSQHRESINRAKAIEMIPKAQAFLRGRLDASVRSILVLPPSPPAPPPPPSLWIADPFVTPGDPLYGKDTWWYMLPVANLAVGSGSNGWDAMLDNGESYANLINGSGVGAGNTAVYLIPALDLLADRKAPYTNGDSFSPFTEAEFMEAPTRFAWYGFYRGLANGTAAFAAATCKISHGDVFAEQAVGVAYPPPSQASNAAPGRRLPVPWRVSVQYDPRTRRISSASSSSPGGGGVEGLGELAPAGSKLMIAGAGFLGGPGPPSMSLSTLAGRVLTVASVFDSNFASGLTSSDPKSVTVIEDTTNLPKVDPTDILPDIWFDVWVFPPPAVAGNAANVIFGAESPLMDWKVNL